MRCCHTDRVSQTSHLAARANCLGAAVRDLQRRMIPRGKPPGCDFLVVVRRAARGLYLGSDGYNGWRSSRAARISPDDVRIRQAAPCTRGSLSPPGIAPATAWTGHVCGSGEVPARTLKAIGPSCPPQARTGVIASHPAFRLWHGTKPGPVAGFARSTRPPASGTPIASASSRDLPHVTADPERLSSRLVRHVRDPSGSGSASSMAWGWKVWKKPEGFCGGHDFRHPRPPSPRITMERVQKAANFAAVSTPYRFAK